MYDEKFHKRNFILHYRQYIDSTIYKENYSDFKNILNILQKEFEGKTFSRSTLFICNSKIEKFVFLSAFATLDKLCSNRYFNQLQLQDIWSYGIKQDNVKLESSEIFSSEQEIRDDVLCVYTDKVMTTQQPAYLQNMIPSIECSRYERRGRNLDNQITWVFFRGTVEDMKAFPGLSNTYNYFCESDFCNVIDLNKIVEKLPKLGRKIENKIATIGDVY